MPRIPRFQRSETISGSAGGVQEQPSVLVGRAVEGFGLQLVDTAEGIGREQERVEAQREKRKVELENEERHYSTLRLGNEINEQALGWEQERTSLRGTDAFHSMEAVDEWETLTREQYLTDLNDIRMARDIEGHIASTGLKLRGSLSRHEAREREKVSADTRWQAFEGAEKAARFGSGSLEENLQSYSKVIASDPRLSETEKENALIEGQSAIALARLEGMVARAPAAATEMVKSGVLDEYLDRTAQNKAQRAARAAVKALEDSQRQQKKERRQREKQALDQAREETGNDFLDLFTDGGLTSAAVLGSVLHPTEGQNSKRAWIERLEKREKKLDKSEEAESWKTNPEIERELLARILEDPNAEGPNAVTDDTLLESLGPDGINGATLRTLRNFREKVVEDPLKTDRAKTAIASLNAAKSGKLFDDDPVENIRKWGESTDLLKRFILNHPDEDASEFVDQLLEKERDGKVRQLFDRLPGLPFVDVMEPFESAEERRARLEAAAGPGGEEPPETEPSPAEKAEVPALEDWLEMARRVNPGVPDEDLTEYYQREYGDAGNR